MKILDIDSDETSDIPAVQIRVSRLDEYIAPLTEEELNILIPLVADWNTNAKFGFVSQAILSSLLRTIKVERLQKNASYANIARGLLSYSERHFNRIDRLQEASYLIDFIAGQASTYVGVPN